MKKPILGILAGFGIAILILIGVLFIIKPEKDDDVSSNNNTFVSESVGDETESEIWGEESEFWEETEGTETQMSESEETESEGTSKIDSASQTNPVDYPYYIKVNRQANCVTIYKKDAEGNYTVPVKAMTCSVGLSGKTPLGVTKISARYKWRPLFGDTYGQYTVRFNGHILFHSVPYMQTSKDTLQEGQYNMLGQPASKGCIRLSVADAKWIYDNCINGTTVEVYDSPDPGPLGKPATYQISEDSPFKGWDPTDPDSANPWKKGKVSITGVKNITLNQGETLDVFKGVKATDVDGLPLQVTVSNLPDTNIPGTYTITYSATGVLWTTATATATVTVNAVEQPEPDVPETEEPSGTENPGNTENPEDTEKPEDTQNSEDTQKPEDTEFPENTEQIGSEASQIQE